MPAKPEASGRVLGFQVGGKPYSLDASAVSEVVRRPPVTRVPQAPSGLAGVANVRGRVLPVVSLAELLDHAADPAGGGRLIVVERPEPLALAVDAVSTFGEAADAQPISLERLLQRTVRRTPARVARTRVEAVPETRTEAAPRQAILCFDVAGQAYGLPLESVAEVRDAPPEILRLSGGDAAIAGVVENRGALLPVVRPEVLLGLPAGERTQARILVVGLEGARLGLLVDQVQAIVRVEAERIVAAPAILNRGSGEARIDSVARTERGLVALLSPARLFREETVAAVLADQSKEGAPMAAAAASETEKLVVFRLGEETYALPISAVEEVIRYPDAVTRVPRAPAFLAGVANHRREALPIVDQRVRFAIPGEAAASGRRVLVTRVGDMRVGFAVDAVDSLVTVDAAKLSETPEIASDGGQLFDRVADIELDGRLVLLVNPRELLDQAERELLAAMAARATKGSK